jgi:hypothetical protein
MKSYTKKKKKKKKKKRIDASKGGPHPFMHHQPG